MATLINNSGVQHYANKMVLAENRKVGSKALPTALADIDTKLDEMKDLFESEYGSALDMKLENNENTFSVGTGNGVDKRAEVENSFTDIEMFGNSMVNNINSESIREFIYEHNSHPALVVNTREFTIDWSKDLKFNSWIQARNNTNPIFNTVKPNTNYTLFLNILENNPSFNGSKYTGSIGNCQLWINGQNPNAKPLPTNITGWVCIGVYNFNRPNENIDYSMFGLSIQGTNSDGNKFIDGGKLRISKDVIFLEGDWTNKPLPQYFEGLQSIGERVDGLHKIEVSSRGKNILKPIYNAKYPFYIKKGTKLVLSTKDNQPSLGGNVMLYDINGTIHWLGIDAGKTTSYRTTTADLFYIQNALAKGVEHQLEISSTPTNYEPYKVDKKQISLNEPLRGLPNGVRDSIENINGEWKIVRRCGGWVITATEPSWRKNVDYTPAQGWSGFNFNFKTNEIFTDRNRPKDNCVRIGNNEFGMRQSGHTSSNRGMDFHSNGNGKFIIESSTVPVGDLNTLKQWLNNNHTEIVYELATPIIEDITPVTLQCWKNGTISIDSTIPVETTHTVALNKPAQIKRNIEELTTLRKRVQALEEFYDKISLEQTHQLDLLNHSYNLDYN